MDGEEDPPRPEERAIHAARSPQFRRRSARALTLVLAAAALAAGPLGAARSAPLPTDSDDITRVSYRGHEFTVPASWQVVDLEKHPDACVRFDRHAVYLGTPGSQQDCPAHAKGRTEALLIQPASAPVTGSAVTENRVARTYRATADRIMVTAAYSYDRTLIQDVLRSAGLPVAAAQDEQPSGSPAVAPLPVDATSFRGEGFDACTAPGQEAMDAWREHSDYGAIGIYIGGINRACSQTNLTAAWVRTQYTKGWRFFPLYVGRQPSSDGGSCQGDCAAITSPVTQGTAAADDAARQAAALGFGKGSVIYSDLENYEPGGTVTDQVLGYVDAYTERLHELGYRAGAYGNTSSLVADLVKNRNDVTLPDVIHFARWNNQATTADPAVPADLWNQHQRIHQYAGDTAETHGGVKISIDRDRLDVG
ncbi:glycoside hydrolase domain-containing protein [Streptomyces sp. 142MFCol3.1]|uniref:glycoside hydrolase domain-containing protein n=1 Tax=Streptomyces sp. 142MFCol3.1 TaxID=1172179 RepID=UPI0003F68ABE|nr:glycoside hydrolase domain-containing protein [Streptomyces sp. 142MFCol3.1]